MYGYTALMQGDDFLCKRHPDAVSFRMLFLLSAVEQGENLFFFCIRHANSVIRQADNGPFIPVGNLDERRFVVRILAVILNQVSKGDVQQVVITHDGNHSVVFRIFLFKNQFDMVFRMGTKNDFPCIK